MESIFKGRTNFQQDWRAAQWHQTPFKRIENGCYFKREDLYAPLGVGGVNGSKVRMGVWWLDHMLQVWDFHELVFAGSVKSPLHVRVAAIARHFDLESTHVLGATNPKSARRHDIIRSIEYLGGTLDCAAKVAYNNVIQKRAALLAAAAGRLQVPYGLWLGREHLRDNLEAFYELSARQLTNWPKDIRRLILPAGTFTTALAVSWGLIRNSGYFPVLREVELPVIGPDHTEWFWKQLANLLGERDENIRSYVRRRGFEFRFHHDKRMANWNDMAKNVVIEDMTFHPSYEAKIIRWIKQEDLDWLEDPYTCFWIIGGHAQLKPMQECEWRQTACPGLE